MARTKKQTEIPGTERPHDEEISEAAEKLYEVRSERMKLTKQEVDLAEKLIEVMKEKKIDHYVDDDLELEVSLRAGKDKVKVKQIRDDEDLADAAEE